MAPNLESREKFDLRTGNYFVANYKKVTAEERIAKSLLIFEKQKTAGFRFRFYDMCKEDESFKKNYALTLESESHCPQNFEDEANAKELWKKAYEGHIKGYYPVYTGYFDDDKQSLDKNCQMRKEKKTDNPFKEIKLVLELLNKGNKIKSVDDKYIKRKVTTDESDVFGVNYSNNYVGKVVFYRVGFVSELDVFGVGFDYHVRYEEDGEPKSYHEIVKDV